MQYSEMMVAISGAKPGLLPEKSGHMVTMTGKTPHAAIPATSRVDYAAYSGRFISNIIEVHGIHLE